MSARRRFGWREGCVSPATGRRPTINGKAVMLITSLRIQSMPMLWGRLAGVSNSCEMVPAASKVAYLASQSIWEQPYIAGFVEVAQRMTISLVGPPLAAPIGEPEYRRVFEAMAREGVDAPMASARSEAIVDRW
jgi:hypothetical protein